MSGSRMSLRNHKRAGGDQDGALQPKTLDFNAKQVGTRRCAPA